MTNNQQEKLFSNKLIQNFLDNEPTSSLENKYKFAEIASSLAYYLKTFSNINKLLDYICLIFKHVFNEKIIFIIPLNYEGEIWFENIKISANDESFKIQEEINNILSNNGLGKIIGYKIGCTNKAIQKELNVVEPIYGALFKNKVIKNNSNLSIKNFIKVGVECEIYVSISKDIIDQDQFSKEKIDNLINYCGLSLEIVEDRFVEIKY